MAAPWDRRSRAEQQRVRDLQLSAWLPQATSFAEHWAEVSARVGLEPGTADDVDDLRRFPSSRELELVAAAGRGTPGLLMRPTERQVKALAEPSTLRDVADAIRRDGAAGRRRVLLEEFKPIHVHAAGVTGELVVAYSRSDLDRLHRTGARAASVLGLGDADYLVDALAPRARLGWWGTYHLALGTSMLALRPRGSGDGIDAVTGAFALAPVTAVVVDLDEAVALAAAVVDSRAAVDRVRTVVVLGPPPTGDLRGEVAEAWRAAGAHPDLSVRALWAPDASRSLWAECQRPDAGLHTYPDLEVLEVLDPVTGSATDADGDLTVTSLGWHGTALLRYRTGAWTEALATDPCPGCGRTVPRVVGEVVPEAWQPRLAKPEGELVVDLRGVGRALDRAGLASWRVELRPPTADEAGDQLVVEIGGELDDERAAAVHREVAVAGGAAPDRVEIVADPALVDAQVQAVGSVFADER